MEVKPGYKQTEVGVIPEKWETHRLGELLQGSRTIRYGIVQPGKFEPTGCFMLRSQDYSKGWAGSDGMHKVSAHLENQYKNARIRHNDLIMTVVGAGIGQVVFAPAWLDGAICSRSTARIAVDESKAAPSFVKAFLESPIGKRQIMDCQKEGAQPVVSCLDLAKFFVAYPPLPEQRAIAEALSDVDALLGALDKLIAKKRDLQQAAMQQLLTGQTRLPGFHGEWAVKRLGNVGTCIRGVTYKGDSDLATQDTDQTKRLLRSNNVQESRVVTSDVQFVKASRVSENQLLKTDDILICMANGSKALVGKAGLFRVDDGYEYAFGAFMGCFRTNSAVAIPAYIFFLFQTGLYRDYINNLLAGSSINNLRPSSIESLDFPIPPLTEQIAIADALSDMNAELAALEQRRAKTHALKQGMMQELLTGKTRLL